MNVIISVVSPVSPFWSAENIQSIPAFKIPDVKINMKRTAFSANSASLIGAQMVDESTMHIGYRAFKIGAVLALLAFVLWAVAIATDYVLPAIIFAAMGTIGALIMLVGVLEGRRREIYHGGR
jgi:hypothetical protein